MAQRGGKARREDRSEDSRREENRRQEDGGSEEARREEDHQKNRRQKGAKSPPETANERAPSAARGRGRFQKEKEGYAMEVSVIGAGLAGSECGLAAGPAGHPGKAL